MKTKKEKKPLRKVRFPDLVYLFFFGSLLGVLLEGLFCIGLHWVFEKRFLWETHVVSMVLPLCIIYGVGAAIYYAVGVRIAKWNIILRFLMYALVGSVVEYAAGWLLEYGLHMLAWDYSTVPGNIQGYLCPGMSAGWGVAGVVFDFLIPPIQKLLDRFECKATRVIAVILCVVMTLDIAAAFVCITRWSHRHFGAPPANAVETYIDEHFPDDWMQHRFIEWHFRD